MKYIIFSDLNRNYLLFILYFIFSTLKHMIIKFYRPTDDFIIYLDENYTYSISDLLTIIPILIIKVRSKTINKNALDTTEFCQNQEYLDSNPLQTIIKENTNKKIKRIFKLEMIISIFDFLGKYTSFIFSIILAKTKFFIKKIALNGVPVFNIISTYILSTLILHSPFYRHHYFSLFINFIFLVVLIIIDQINIFKEEDWSTNILYIINILTGIFFSFENIYGKVILSSESISPYILIFYRGIIVSVITVLLSIILIFVDIPDENGENSCIFTRYWKIYENKINILYTIGIALVNFFFNINIYFIIDKFSPAHYAIATILDMLISLLIEIFFGDTEISDFFIKLIIYIILIFASLIYNEIIILNFCGLQIFTKSFLEIEANMDISQIKINNNTFDEDDFEKSKKTKQEEMKMMSV